VLIEGKKKWIATPEVFETLGYQWTAVVITDQATLSSIPDFEDNLIRAIGDTKVWLVVNGIRHHIPSPEVFLDYGFLWSDIKDVPQTTVDQYRLASLIRETGQTGNYYISPSGIRKLIPTTEIFNSYGYNLADVQVISKLEMASYKISNLMRYNNQIYLLEGTVKRLIPTDTILARYDSTLIIDANVTEFNWYQLGTNVQ
jgi:hypothetical protein